MKILIASSSDIAIPLIEDIVKSGQHEFCGLLSYIDKATGRGQSIRSNNLAEWAKNSGVKIYQSASANDIKQIVAEVLPDVVITIAFGQIIKEDSLKIPKNGWLNVHFSKLPRWRGAASASAFFVCLRVLKECYRSARKRFRRVADSS